MGRGSRRNESSCYFFACDRIPKSIASCQECEYLTPVGTTGGPSHDKLTNKRVTKLIYLWCNIFFDVEVTDDWTDKTRAHLALGFKFIGYTMFVEAGGDITPRKFPVWGLPAEDVCPEGSTGVIVTPRAKQQPSLKSSDREIEASPKAKCKAAAKNSKSTRCWDDEDRKMKFSAVENNFSL